MYAFSQDDKEINLEELRHRLQRMDEEALKEFGRAAAFLCQPQQCAHGKPRDAFVIQLQEARAEWRRRSHAKRQSET